MALINRAKKEINTKIVYFGLPLAGKTATLESLFKMLPPEFRGTLKSMAVRDDRMLFFDFLPLGAGKLDGYTVRVHLYTAPGTIADMASWKIVLKGADGVVFVADSAATRLEANRESLEQLRGLLQGGGRNLEEIPLIVQGNKSDVTGAASPETVAEVLGGGLDVVAASAATGEGVMPVLSMLVKQVLETISNTQMEGRGEGPLRLTALELPEKEKAGVIVEAAVNPEIAAGIEPELMIDGAPEPLGNGLLRLPLVIRFDGKEKKVTLKVAISLEQ